MKTIRIISTMVLESGEVIRTESITHNETVIQDLLEDGLSFRDLIDVGHYTWTPPGCSDTIRVEFVTGKGLV